MAMLSDLPFNKDVKQPSINHSFNCLNKIYVIFNVTNRIFCLCIESFVTCYAETYACELATK